MNKITKMTHKALKEMGEMLNGYYFDGNIYAHENRVHYLSSVVCDWRKDERIEEAKAHNHEIAALIDEIVSTGANEATTRQLAYSCGIYGNSGQLHRIDYTKNGEAVKTIYLYC